MYDLSHHPFIPSSLYRFIPSSIFSPPFPSIQPSLRSAHSGTGRGSSSVHQSTITNHPSADNRPIVSTFIFPLNLSTISHYPFISSSLYRFMVILCFPHSSVIPSRLRSPFDTIANAITQGPELQRAKHSNIPFFHFVFSFIFCTFGSFSLEQIIIKFSCLCLPEMRS